MRVGAKDEETALGNFHRVQAHLLCLVCRFIVFIGHHSGYAVGDKRYRLEEH